mmetsp:Transcript_11848/g.17388  ORF Transcript_11848/g.17388 Transcript_11848/m.17388 type:complete len:291 (-) Transcript_11848:53-925(-)
MIRRTVIYFFAIGGTSQVVDAFLVNPSRTPAYQLSSPLDKAPFILDAQRVDTADSALSTTAAKNGAVLSLLFGIGAYCVLHHDVERLVALPDNVDTIKAGVSMLRDLPTEWLAWYDDEALTYPLLTKASTSGVCYFLGDLCAQTLRGKDLEELQLDRATRSCIAGFIGHGPIAHYWLNFLDTYLSFDNAWWSAIPKIIIDQGPMSIVYNTIYSVLLGSLAFRDVREVLRDVKGAFWPSFLASIRFWPAVHLVTFNLVPIELQLLWVDACEIVWVCILSQVNNEVIEEKAE